MLTWPPRDVLAHGTHPVMGVGPAICRHCATHGDLEAGDWYAASAGMPRGAFVFYCPACGPDAAAQDDTAARLAEPLEAPDTLSQDEVIDARARAVFRAGLYDTRKKGEAP